MINTNSAVGALRWASAAALALLLTASQAEAETPVRPGLWELRTADTQGVHISRACAHGRGDPPLDAAANESLSCMASRRDPAPAARIRFTARCQGPNGETSGLIMTGRASSNRLDLQILRQDADGSVIEAVSVRGRRLSAHCPLSGR